MNAVRPSTSAAVTVVPMPASSGAPWAVSKIRVQAASTASRSTSGRGLSSTPDGAPNRLGSRARGFLDRPLDGVDGEARCGPAAGVAAHAIGHDEEPKPLVHEERILVVVAALADVRLANRLIVKAGASATEGA